MSEGALTRVRDYRAATDVEEDQQSLEQTRTPEQARALPRFTHLGVGRKQTPTRVVLRPMHHSILLLAVSLTLLGCGLKMDGIIRHPLRVGVVDQPNTITHRNGWQSTLTLLDDSIVCFDVRFSVSSLHEQTEATLAGRSLQMHAEGTWFQDARVTQNLPSTVTAHRFTRMMRQQDGSSMQCTSRNPNTNQCEQSERRPTYRTVAVPTVRYESTGGGSVCFPNQRRVTPDTPRVSFSIDEVKFRWGLQGGRGMRQL